MCPIVGLTDTVKAEFPSLGILRKGRMEQRTRKDGSTYEVPVDLEHFRFTSDRPEIEEAFREAYGEKPTSLPFYFQYDGTDDVWSAWKEEWVAGGLVHRCDGQTMVLHRSKESGYTTNREPCPYHTGEKERDPKKNPGCKAVGRLRILLPGLLEAGFIGDVTFLTGSLHDIRSIQACLEEIMQYRQGMGLRGIEFVVRRDLKPISTPEVGRDGKRTGKRIRRKKSLVTIAPAARWVQFQLQAAERAVYMLEAGDDEPVGDDDGDLDDELDLGYAAAVLPTTPARQADPATGEIAEPEAEDAEYRNVEEPAQSNGTDWSAALSDDAFTVPADFEPRDDLFAQAFDTTNPMPKHNSKTVGLIETNDPDYLTYLATKYDPTDADDARKAVVWAARYILSYRRWQAHAGQDNGAQTTANGTAQRPLSPEQMQAAIKQVMAQYPKSQGKTPESDTEKKMLGLLAGKLAEPFGRGKAGSEARHMALEWLFGKGSTNGLDMQEIRAALYWLLGDRDDDGSYPYKPHALDELRGIVDARRAELGQLGFDDAETPQSAGQGDAHGNGNGNGAPPEPEIPPEVEEHLFDEAAYQAAMM